MREVEEEGPETLGSGQWDSGAICRGRGDSRGPCVPPTSQWPSHRHLRVAMLL